MAARYVITDEVTGDEIPVGMPHFEVQFETRNINGVPVWQAYMHFLKRDEMLEFIRNEQFVSVTIKQK